MLALIGANIRCSKYAPLGRSIYLLCPPFVGPHPVRNGHQRPGNRCFRKMTNRHCRTHQTPQRPSLRDWIGTLVVLGKHSVPCENYGLNAIVWQPTRSVRSRHQIIPPLDQVRSLNFCDNFQCFQNDVAIWTLSSVIQNPSLLIEVTDRTKGITLFHPSCLCPTCQGEQFENRNPP